MTRRTRSSTKCEIVVIGAGRHGSEIYSYLHDLGAGWSGIRLAGFFDAVKPQGPWNGTQILGDLKELERFARCRHDSPVYYITAFGENPMRRQFVDQIRSLDAPNLVPWTLLHPRALVGHDVEVGEGTCLAPGAIVTTRARIGRHCILNVNASVSHDCVVGDFVNINPGAVVCGDVKLGEGCYVGAGATVVDKVSVGEWTILGAGAVVIENIPAHVTAVGVPARVIKTHTV